MPADITLARASDLTNSRYAFTLSSGKKLLLFRLPDLPSAERKANSVDGFAYWAMESEVSSVAVTFMTGR